MSGEYEVQVSRFLDGMFDAGRFGEPFVATVEALADDEGVDLNDATWKQAETKWRHGQVKSLTWAQVYGGEPFAAAVTSGGTPVLLTVHDRPVTDPQRVSMEEVTREGVPFRVMGTYRNVGEAFDVWGLRAP